MARQHKSSEHEGSQTTFRRSAELIESTVTGRITGAVVLGFVNGFKACGGAPDWLVNGDATTGYSLESVKVAGESIRSCRELGLKRLIAVIKSPVVRMGASAVALTAQIDFKVVSTYAEAERILASPRH